MNPRPGARILLIMPPFWDPICPPQGIVCLRAHLAGLGYEAHIADFNTDRQLFDLQRKYFDIGIGAFPHWRHLNVYRNGPRYFARHQMAWLLGGPGKPGYVDLARRILNFDGRSECSPSTLDALDAVVAEMVARAEAKTEELVRRLNPDVVGCTLLESTAPAALAILRKAKAVSPTVTTLLGGPGVVLGNTPGDGNLQRLLARCGWVDAILHGEGERLIECCLAGAFGDRKLIGVHDLEGASAPAGKPGGVLLGLDSLAPPDYEGLAVPRYLWLSVFGSRGCPYRCSFCFENRFWMRFRKKSLERLIEEMKTLSERYGKAKFYICDSLANHLATPLSLALQARGASYRWDCYMRVTSECLDDAAVKLWATAGMERARIGVETASPRVLELMQKGISPADTSRCLSLFARHGIYTTTLWIAGFPGERDEDFQESLDFLRQNRDSIYQADMWEFVCLPEDEASPAPPESSFASVDAYPGADAGLLPVRYCEVRNGVSPVERFARIERFERLRAELKIPNPYSLRELVDAESRWMALGHQATRRGLF